MSDSCKCGCTALRLDGSQVDIEIDTRERHHTRERCDLEVTHSAECWQWHNGCAVARIEAVRELCDAREEEETDNGGYGKAAVVRIDYVRDVLDGGDDE